ncbi:biotin carboxylase [Amycolatopsis antarctica]|uniref:Biotin carboxylase n=1 Tax=Amycolatopsis antarctica TaxID=1854586 RepID=A0A263CYS6_9PSEU|nr:ATP-grasp domain-containing protein [Amycolatopsis antarctica]OZM71119.1 biotin carboxylase [Amycolatopsis antarctica]
MTRDIFVLGLDSKNFRTFADIEGLAGYEFHPLLSFEEMLEADRFPMAELLAKAERQLDEFDGTVDAIVGYWDFPVSSMVPILCARRKLRSASLESVLKCEHKYWSRVEQAKVIDEYPRFGLVPLDSTEPPAGVGFPMWVKPVKAFSSELAFRVTDRDQFVAALAEVRDGIGRVGEAFQYVLDRADLPADIAEIGAQVCVAEEAVGGRQVTVEGYDNGDGVHVYGVIDSHDYPGTSSFQRYQYPSSLPEQTQRQMADISRRVIEHIGLTSVAFNIEYFWDPQTDEINLLEINPRHSQSHAMLFDYVDGVPNHQCVVNLALGIDPDMPYRKGPYQFAAKWFVRRFADGVVHRGPTPEELSTMERTIPGCVAEVLAHEGDRLSDLPEQDSYSYAYATVHVGADSEEELATKYAQCLDALPFEFGDDEPHA